MSCYIPVSSNRREDCEALYTLYLEKGFLGKGSFGKVHEACIRGTEDCGYVLKTSTMDVEKYNREGGKSFERYYREWANEVDIHLKLNERQDKYRLKFSPCIYDWWYCDEGEKVHFYILIERYDGDLNTLLKNKTSFSVSMTLDRMEAYLAIIHYTCRICLNDISLRNMLYKQIGADEYEIVFADFGMASKDSDDECIRIDGDRFIEVKNKFMIRRYG